MALSAAEKAKRRLSIGGSDLSAIAGVNPHRSAFTLYLQKIGEDRDDDRPDTDAQMFGHVFEEPTAQIYQMRHGCELRSFSETLTHPDFPFITANPDRVLVESERLIEIKTTGAGGIKFWFDPENMPLLKVPQHVILQTNHYMGMLGWSDADVVLLNFAESFNVERYHEFKLEFDSELYDLCIEMAIRFWNENVQARVAPEAEDPQEMSEYLAHHYKNISSEVLVATTDDTKIAMRRAHAMAQEKHWKEQKIIEDNALKDRIGDKSGIKNADFTYTWTYTKSGGIDYRGLAESFNPTPSQIEAFTRPGYRKPYFRFKGQLTD